MGAVTSQSGSIGSNQESLQWERIQPHQRTPPPWDLTPPTEAPIPPYTLNPMAPTVVPPQPAGIQLVPTVVSTQPPCMPVAFPFQGMSIEMQTSLFQHFMAMQTMQAATMSSRQPAKPATPTPVQPESSVVQPTVLQVQTVEPMMTLLSRAGQPALAGGSQAIVTTGTTAAIQLPSGDTTSVVSTDGSSSDSLGKGEEVESARQTGVVPLEQTTVSRGSTFIPPSHGPRAQASTMLTLDDIDTRNNIAPANVINQHKIV
jgi:hypothetical protein